MFKKHSLIIGFLVFIATHLTIMNIVTHETTCHDGSYSDSIGSRGACSHHGGVKTSNVPLLSFFFSIGLGIFVKVRLEESKPKQPDSVDTNTKPTYLKKEVIPTDVFIFPQRVVETSKFKGYEGVISNWVNSYGIDWTIKNLYQKGVLVSEEDINYLLGRPLLETKPNNKICTNCGKSKSKQSFYHSKKSGDGSTKWCKLCLKTHNKKKEK